MFGRVNFSDPDLAEVGFVGASWWAPSGEDDDLQLTPPELDQMEPGPLLAAILSRIDLARISGYDQVVVLRAHTRMTAHYQAQAYAGMAAVAGSLADIDPDDPELAYEAAAAEVRAALRLTRRGADAELELALDLTERLPEVHRALEGGLIDRARARVLIAATAHLPVEAARRVVDHIIEDAGRYTTGQLAAKLRKLCIAVDPEDAARRYEDAVADRRVVTDATSEGTANLFALDLPPHLAAAAARRINHLARSLKTADDTRTMDQMRADVFLDLLLCRGHSGGVPRGTVDIHVDLETLAGLADSSGDLAGYGPVIADIARQVSVAQGDAEWRFTVTHPESGAVLHTGTTRRRPTAGERRSVETRDRTCIFPGCRMPSLDCDLDHRIPWSEGGPTTVEELAPGCRYDHVTIKHRCGWTYRRLPDGDYLWTSRLGHLYTTSGRSP